MGLGRLFGGRSSTSQTNQINAQKVSAANAQNAQAQAQRDAALKAGDAGVAALAAKQMGSAADGQARAAAHLGILDYIKTSSEGLQNNNLKTGKLTILGN